MALEGCNLHTLCKLCQQNVNICVRRNLRQQFSRSWLGILRQRLAVLIAEEVNWQMADGGVAQRRQTGSHNLEGQHVVATEMNLGLGVSRNRGDGARSLLRRQEASHRHSYFLAPRFPYCHRSTFS